MEGFTHPGSSGDSLACDALSGLVNPEHGGELTAVACASGANMPAWGLHALHAPLVAQAAPATCGRRPVAGACRPGSSSAWQAPATHHHCAAQTRQPAHRERGRLSGSASGVCASELGDLLLAVCSAAALGYDADLLLAVCSAAVLGCNSLHFSGVPTDCVDFRLCSQACGGTLCLLLAVYSATVLGCDAFALCASAQIAY